MPYLKNNMITMRSGERGPLPSGPVTRVAVHTRFRDSGRRIRQRQTFGRHRRLTTVWRNNSDNSRGLNPSVRWWPFSENRTTNVKIFFLKFDIIGYCNAWRRMRVCRREFYIVKEFSRLDRGTTNGIRIVLTGLSAHETRVRSRIGKFLVLKIRPINRRSRFDVDSFIRIHGQSNLYDPNLPST